MVEHYNCKWLLKLNIAGITFGEYIFYAYPKYRVSDRLRKHERTHVEQYRRDGVVKFLCKYLYEYFKYRLQGMSHNQAYLNISYEKEARGVV